MLPGDLPLDHGYSAVKEGDHACEHEPVFSGEHHPTTNPIWFYVCAKCGRLGKASYDTPDKTPPINRPRFAQLMLDLHGERHWLERLAKRNAQLPAPTDEER